VRWAAGVLDDHEDYAAVTVKPTGFDDMYMINPNMLNVDKASLYKVLEKVFNQWPLVA